MSIFATGEGLHHCFVGESTPFRLVKREVSPNKNEANEAKPLSGYKLTCQTKRKPQVRVSSVNGRVIGYGNVIERSSGTYEVRKKEKQAILLFYIIHSLTGILSCSGRRGISYFRHYRKWPRSGLSV